MLPVHVLLNKSDKLTRGAGMNVLLQVRKDAGGLWDSFGTDIFCIEQAGAGRVLECFG